jgi:DNA-binding MarR family transcriptional regulator
LASSSARESKPHDDRGGDTRTAIDAFRAIVQALRTTARDAERRAGVSAAQLFALHELAQHAGLSVNELAARTFTHQSSVSVVVQRLADRRLILRRPSPDDGRRVQLEITAAGRRILRRAPEPVQQRLVAAVGALPPARRTLLAETLQEIARGVSVEPRPPAMFFEDAGRGSRRRRRRS